MDGGDAAHAKRTGRVKPVDLVAWSLVLLLAPFFILVVTGFIKFAVVLSILRRALGGSAIPPASVTAALALLMALFVTAPVGERVWAQAGPSLGRGQPADLAAAAGKAAE